MLFPHMNDSSALTVPSGAETLARRLHQHQMRHGGLLPYITHPAQVAALAASWGAPGYVVDACWLHDTIEDCGATVESLIDAGIDPAAASLVEAVTRTSDLTYTEFIRQVIAAGPDAVVVKVADVLTNLSTPMPAAKQGLERRYFLALEMLLPHLPEQIGSLVRTV